MYNAWEILYNEIRGEKTGRKTKEQRVVMDLKDWRRIAQKSGSLPILRVLEQPLRH